MNNNNNSVIKLHLVQNNKVVFGNRHFMIAGFDVNMNVVQFEDSETDLYEKFFKTFIQFPKNKYKANVFANCSCNLDALRSHFESLLPAVFTSFITLKFETVESELKMKVYIDEVLDSTYSLEVDAVTHTYEFETALTGNINISFDVTPTAEKIVQVVKYTPADQLDMTQNRFIDSKLFEMVNVSDTHKSETRTISNNDIKYVLAYSVLDLT